MTPPHTDFKGEKIRRTKNIPDESPGFIRKLYGEKRNTGENDEKQCYCGRLGERVSV